MRKFALPRSGAPRAVLSVLSLALLAGCGTSLVGSGPITLSLGCQLRFADFQSLDNPDSFAVSTDGRACGYSYCEEMACVGYGEQIAVESCERSSKSVPCKIYAFKNKVVWRKTLPPDVAKTEVPNLGKAVIAGDVEKVQALLSAGADANAEVSFTRPDWNRGEEWNTRVLVAAIVYQHPKVVDLLLRHKVSFDMYHNAFAICPAVNSGQSLVVLDLIKAGIDVNPKFTCIRGLSPLESAKQRHYDGIVKMLVEAGAT